MIGITLSSFLALLLVLLPEVLFTLLFATDLVFFASVSFVFDSGSVVVFSVLTCTFGVSATALAFLGAAFVGVVLATLVLLFLAVASFLVATSALGAAAAFLVAVFLVAVGAFLATFLSSLSSLATVAFFAALALGAAAFLATVDFLGAAFSAFEEVVVFLVAIITKFLK
ncbi:MAG TPA: hypothetical protein VKZ76_08665 [Edaphocola sp.]|nr:hypothetical protein [Edaphocola sp.]